MDIAQFKQLARQLHSFLKPQLGLAFKLGHAQELMATLAGVRSWSEALSFPNRLKATVIDEPSLQRLATRIEQQYAAKVSPDALHALLVPQADPMMIRTPHPPVVPGRVPPRWLCDVCGGLIDSVDRAYVVWKGSATSNHSFRIIHQSDCDTDESFHRSNPLRDYVGQEGLNRLLAFLSDGPIIGHIQQHPSPPISNHDEIVDFIRRCQIPNYDLARRLFKDPRVISEFQDAGEYSPYQPDTLARTLRDYGGQQP